MSDLISRCKLFNSLAKVQTLGEAYGVIQGMKTEDAVQVVRCKDCMHWYSDADAGMACDFTNLGQPEDGFCNWGERKDGKAD